jgi:transcriptional regulator with XRE-family HTH domain
MSTLVSFQEIITQARAMLRLNQSEVGKIAGISQRRLSSIEAGLARPSLQEVTAIAEALKLSAQDVAQNSDWERGCVMDGWQEERRRAFAGQVKVHLPELQPSTRAFRDKLETARKSHLNLVRKLEYQISLRPDARSIWLAFGEIWCDSSLEVLFWLHLAAGGASPIWTSPLELGFRRHAVTDWDHELLAGDVPKVSLWHKQLGIAIPQVSLIQPKRRIDALLRLPHGRFVAIEIDGEGHNGSWDENRDRQMKIQVVRFDGAALLVQDFVERLQRSTQ